MMDSKVPKIHIDPQKIMKEDIDMVLMSKHDMFYRRIVEFVLDKLEGKKGGETLAILIDDDGVEYEMSLPKNGYNKSLMKALRYFEKIEEFETCDLIKQMINKI